jgi:hypothetical protein
MANENISNDSGPIQPPEWNLSELARQHGKHRKTIKRWIDNGWRPDQHGDIKPEPEIMPPAQDQQDDARPAHQAIIKAEPEMLPPGPPAQEDARHAHQAIIKAEPEMLPPGPPAQEDARHAHQDVIRAGPEIILPHPSRTSMRRSARTPCAPLRIRAFVMVGAPPAVASSGWSSPAAVSRSPIPASAPMPGSGAA